MTTSTAIELATTSAIESTIETFKPSPFQVLTSSESNEWYTPPHILKRVRQLGRIGLDPASNAIAQQWIQARCYFTIEQDGLSRDWICGNGYGLWLNPPYGSKGKSNQGAGAWIKKAIASYQDGFFDWAVLLVRGDSKAVHELEKKYISCEPFERIAFVNPNDPTAKGNPVPGCRLWYLGAEANCFYEAFRDFGSIRVPY